MFASLKTSSREMINLIRMNKSCKALRYEKQKIEPHFTKWAETMNVNTSFYYRFFFLTLNK